MSSSALRSWRRSVSGGSGGDGGGYQEREARRAEDTAVEWLRSAHRASRELRCGANIVCNRPLVDNAGSQPLFDMSRRLIPALRSAAIVSCHWGGRGPCHRSC